MDLITYEVAKVQPLQMREVTEGTGGKCGSSMLNMRFRRYLKQIHGDKYWTDERLVVALSEFEAVCILQTVLKLIISLTVLQFKRDFSPKGEPLTLKVDSSLGLKRDRFAISQEDMTTKIWDPIMKDIICLIKEQISLADEKVAAVVLVGGFGQSAYLRSRVRDVIVSRVRVLQPENGVTAVVKGAVIYGLGNYQPAMALVGIASRVARRSYGTCLLTKYDPAKHNRDEA